MSSVGQMVDEKCGCGGRFSMGQGRCSSCAVSKLGGSEESGRQEGHLDYAVRRSGKQLLSGAVYADVKGKEDAGHECTFCCTCWTDE